MLTSERGDQRENGGHRRSMHGEEGAEFAERQPLALLSPSGDIQELLQAPFAYMIDRAHLERTPN